MQIVIDIDENVFTRLFDNGIQDNEIAVDDICEMARALRTGIPLPKGHGNLYDERDLKKLGNVYFQEVITKDSNLEFHFPELIINTTPIIESDKGE